jgi:MoxR-like ATPase
MFKVIVDYPAYQDELVVIERMIGPAVELRTLLSPERLMEIQREVERVYVDPRVAAYAATLVNATRHPAEEGLEHLRSALMFGASPRASINLTIGARALAYIRGRDYVLPQDIAELAPDVLRHRLVLSYEGIANGTSIDAIIAAILQRFPPPRIDMGDRNVG